MELHNLRPAGGSTHSTKRVGRGIGSGKGRTSKRGHKGAKSRSGFKNKRNFEGGQMPLQMRLPKIGFNSPNRVAYVPLNLGQVQHYAEKFALSEVSVEILREKGIISKTDLVKLLAKGEISSAVKVRVHKTSAKASELVTKAGGSVELI